jgi:hypothetical protein
MRNCVLIAYPFATLFRQGTGYEMINEGAQLNESTAGKAGNGYNLERTRRRIKHPSGDLKRSAMRLPNQEILNAIVLVVAGHQNGLADQRMERIGDDRFGGQKPGTMAPAQMTARKTGPSWLR